MSETQSKSYTLTDILKQTTCALGIFEKHNKPYLHDLIDGEGRYAKTEDIDWLVAGIEGDRA